MRAKIWKEFVHFFGLFVSMGLGFWVAGQREPRDTFPYFGTAMAVTFVALMVYFALVYLLSLAWSRWRRSSN
jgi:Zn-dependent protease with chaperone function